MSVSRLQGILDAHKIKATVVNEIIGARIITYEVRPSTNAKMSQIKLRLPDIALGMGAEAVRLTTIPEHHTYGIEVPRKEVDVVRIKDLLNSSEFKNSSTRLTIGIGKNISGKAIVGGLENMPHLLIGGTTKSGKSVFLNSLINCLLYKHSPVNLRFLMIDPKMIELTCYDEIPHLLAPVITDPQKAVSALRWAVAEMDNRYAKFAYNAKEYDIILRNIEDAHRRFRHHDTPYIVIVIDELADLMMASNEEVQESIIRVAQKGRAAGIHLVIATQRPDKDVVTGLIKANLPSKIAFKTASDINSRIILGVVGAEKLLGKGDMLYHPEWELNPMRVQSGFVTDNEIIKMVNYIKNNNKEVFYNGDLVKALGGLASA